MPERCRLFYAIFQVLLCHDGTIQDFTLSMKADESCFEIDQILRHLSRTNSVKKLKLDLYSYSEYTLPSHFFSLTQLTYLYLRGCEIDLIPTFSGFGRLTTLFVEELKKSNIEKFLKLLFKSPLLKTATLNIGFDDVDYIGDSTIIDLFKCLPVIEHLSLWYGFLQCFQPSVELPQLVHLKYFCIEQMCFIEDDHIHMLVPMITSFPNLEKLKFKIYHNLFEDDPRGLFTTENYSDIRFEHLREFDIINVSWRKDEMEFVKLILAKSPVLKKVRILLCNGVQIEQISETLSLFPRASSVVEVTVGNGLIGFAQDQPPPPRQQPSMREMFGEITRGIHHMHFDVSQIGQQLTSMQTRNDAIFDRWIIWSNSCSRLPSHRSSGHHLFHLHITILSRIRVTHNPFTIMRRRVEMMMMML